MAARPKLCGRRRVKSENRIRFLGGPFLMELGRIGTLLLLTASMAFAQIASFDHIVVIVQENRTPDNLFQALCAPPYGSAGSCSAAPNASQYNIQTNYWLNRKSRTGFTTPATVPLANKYDLNHAHSAFVAMCDADSSGTCKMDGATGITCGGICPRTPQFKYVDNSTGLLNPYLDLASQYGFANYMFQTNQGPSFPAHQFLFTGTSAPVAYNDPGDTQMMWQWFVAENYVSTTTDSYGCNAPSGSFLYEIEPSGTEVPGYIPSGQVAGFPCYEHPTLSDLLDANTPPISWRYYGNMTPDSLWNAPNAINHICMPSGGVCNGPAWTNGSVALQSGQILTDIGNCQLPQVSWIIPDGNWSDHAGTVSTDGGPSWVAAIVSAVGNSWSNSNHKCDYWGTNSNDSTAILITWDDWG